MPSYHSHLESLYLADNRVAHSALMLKHMRKGVTPSELVYEHPFADEWLDWAHEALGEYLLPRNGVVYVATNAASKVPLFKVGQTRLSASARVTSLRTAGVLGHYVLLGEWWVRDRHFVEAQALARLRARYEHDRELIAAPCDTVLEVVAAVVGEEERRFRLLSL